VCAGLRKNWLDARAEDRPYILVPDWSYCAWITWFILLGVTVGVGGYLISMLAPMFGLPFKWVCTDNNHDGPDWDTHLCFFSAAQSFPRGIIVVGQLGAGLFFLGQVGVGVIFGMGQVVGGCGFTIAQITLAGHIFCAQLGLAWHKVGRAQMGLHALYPFYGSGDGKMNAPMNCKGNNRPPGCLSRACRACMRALVACCSRHP